MYGLAPDTDLSFLLKKRLAEVAVGLGQVQLNFEDGVSIYIYSSYDIHFGDRFVPGQPLPHGAANLLGLPGSIIECVAIEEKGTLSLTFSTGNRVIVYDDDDHYESYEIFQLDGAHINV